MPNQDILKSMQSIQEELTAQKAVPTTMDLMNEEYENRKKKYNIQKPTIGGSLAGDFFGGVGKDVLEVGKQSGGLAEAGLSTVHGMLNFIPSLAVAAPALAFKGPEAAERVQQKYLEKTTFQPQTEYGRQFGETLQKPFAGLTEAVNWVGEKVFPNDPKMQSAFRLASGYAMLLLPSLKGELKARVGRAIESVKSGKLISPSEMADVFKGVADEITPNFNLPKEAKGQMVGVAAKLKKAEKAGIEAPATLPPMSEQGIVPPVETPGVEPPVPGGLTEPTEMTSGGVGFPGILKKKPPLPAIEQRILDQIETRPNRVASFVQGVKSFLDPKTAVQRTLDRFDSLQQFERRIQKETGRPIGVAESAYGQASLYARRQGVLDVELSILRDDILSPIHNYIEEFTVYKNALQNISRARRGFGNPKGITGFEAAGAIDSLRNRLGPNEFLKLQVADHAFKQWSDTYILKRLVDSGVISGTERAMMLLRNEDWFPFGVKGGATAKASIETVAGDLAKLLDVDSLKEGENAGARIGEALYKLEGTKRGIEDPWQTLMDRHALAQSVAEKNIVYQNVVKESRGSAWAEGVVFKAGKGTPLPDGYGTFSPIFDGKVQTWAAPVDMIESLNSLNSSQTTFINRMMSKQRSILTAGATAYNLPFSIKNFFRDIQMAFLTAKHSMLSQGVLKGVKNFVMGFADAASLSWGMPSPTAKRFLAGKAGYGGLINREIERAWGRPLIGKANQLFETHGQVAAHEISKNVNPFHGLRNIASTIEYGNRMALFRTAEAAGLKGVEAGWAAVRGTVDFSRHGASKGAIEIARNFVPFLQARINTKLATFEALSGKSAWGPKAATAALRAGTVVMMPALAAQLWNILVYPEQYKSLMASNRDDLDTFFVVITGEAKDPKTGRMEPTFYKIPKGDIGSLLYNPFQHGIEKAWAGKPAEFGIEALKLMNEISPAPFMQGDNATLERLLSTVLPPVMKAPAEWVGGKNLYWGTPVVPAKLQNVEPREQYTEKTPALFKKIGDLLNLSPLKLRNLAQNFGGTVAANPSPQAIWDSAGLALKGKVAPGASRDIYDVNAAASTGYATAKLRAERAVAKKDRAGSVKAMEDWNEKMRDMVKKMGEATGEDPRRFLGTPWFKQFFFSRDDMNNTIKNAILKETGKLPSNIEKRLKLEIK